MLPKLRLVVAAVVGVFLLVALATSLYSGSRNAAVFAIGLRSANGSPLERSLPEPPDVRQVAALMASRRAEELNRLLTLEPAPAAAVADEALPQRNAASDPASADAAPGSVQPDTEDGR